MKILFEPHLSFIPSACFRTHILISILVFVLILCINIVSLLLQQLGASLGSLRPTSSVLILREPKKPLDEKEEKVKKFEQLFDEVSERVKAVSAIESF